MKNPIIIIDPSQLRPHILEQRSRSGLTQGDVARRLGIHQQSYARLELAPERARADRLLKVLQLLGTVVTFSEQATEEELKQKYPW